MYEAETNAIGERMIWLERVRVDKLGAMHERGDHPAGGDGAMIRSRRLGARAPAIWNGKN
jgi:hypothetical protein